MGDPAQGWQPQASIPDMMAELARKVADVRPELSSTVVNRIGDLYDMYRVEMQEGTRLQYRAWAMRNEAEGASDGYVEMRGDFRQRVGKDGYGNATNDYRFSQYSEAQKAGKDNGWYMQRAIMDATMATMHFAKAEAIQADIHRLLMSG